MSKTASRTETNLVFAAGERTVINVNVNGTQRHLEVVPSDLLLDVLRSRLGLTGTKRSCDVQICGTCTVLLGGVAISSCTTLALEADGRSVLTVEGLASDEVLHPLQQAFIEEFAMQCGFCTPGFLMMGLAHLAEHPAATPEDIRHYLKGTVCRCGSYDNIIRAIVRAQPAKVGCT